MAQYLAYAETFAAYMRHPAVDMLVIAFFLGAGFLWGMMGGKAKLLSFLLSTYLALFISPLIFNLLDSHKLGVHIYRNLLVYGVVLALLFIFTERIFLRGMGRASYRWLSALFVSFLSVGLFVAGTLNIISFRGIIQLSPITKTLFAGPDAYVVWAIAPIIGLVLLSRRS
ncbi:MAG: hypothetical protein AAB367_01915 [Patescibacteria group bacterium]